MLLIPAWKYVLFIAKSVFVVSKNVTKERHFGCVWSFMDTFTELCLIHKSMTPGEKDGRQTDRSTLKMFCCMSRKVCVSVCNPAGKDGWGRYSTCVFVLIMQTRPGRTSCFLSDLWPRGLHRSETTGRKGRCGGEAGLKGAREAGEVFAAGLEANFCQKMCFSFLTCRWSMVTPVKSSLAVWTAAHCLFYPGTPYISSGMALKKEALCRFSLKKSIWGPKQ